MPDDSRDQIDSAELQAEARAFRAGFDSVILATQGEAGPDASYAPCLLDDDEAVCIFVSELASHTRNLFGLPRASLLFIEPESEARNPFARRRLALQCDVSEIPRDSDAGGQRLDALRARFGKTVDLLRSLPDFHLLRFDVTDGSYVRGFAQAYALRGNNLEILQRRTRG
ncbi:MAG TPA: HugZ family protein [Chromatiaceae bacterium]|nr:HugZ family protein [Chromatiaceae bacterium]